MSGFINTIDEFGEDAVITSIIDRTITKFEDNIITEVGKHAFHGCTSLSYVDLPNVTDIRQYAFRETKTSSKLNFPKLEHVENNAFQNGELPEILSLPSLFSAYGDAIFMGCKGVKHVDLPKLTSIPLRFMQNIQTLEIVDLSSCTSIASGAFYNDALLSVIILRSDAICTLSKTDAFEVTPISSGTGYIYVPRALIEDYKVDTNWATYASQFRALEDYTVDGTTTGELDETKI